MFDFQKLTIYQKEKDYNKEITQLIKESNFDRTTNKHGKIYLLLDIHLANLYILNNDS